MATSPNFSWPEPDNSDLVKNGALAIRTAVDAIDSSMADLKGGTTGQVLSKASNTDMDFSWATASGGSNLFYAGKNKIINGDFRFNQRNFTSNTTDLSYNFDRWRQQNSGGSFTTTPQTFTLGTAPVTGYEGTNFLQGIVASQSASTDNAIFTQQIESVRTFANQTVTISFWAKAGSGTPKIAVEAQQYFGASGSPSSRVNTYFGQVTLSTSWARYSVTGTVPSISGKTLGTDGSDCLYINLWVSGGSTWNSRTGSIGLQNATFQIWGVQAEAGSTMTDFQTATGNPASELAACQRYYEAIAILAQRNVMAAQSTSSAFGALYYKVSKRGTPTVTLPASGSGSGQIAVLNNSGSYPSTIGTVAADQITVDSCTIKVTGATSAYTAGDAVVLYTNGAATIAVGAEL